MQNQTGSLKRPCHKDKLFECQVVSFSDVNFNTKVNEGWPISTKSESANYLKQFLSWIIHSFFFISALDVRAQCFAPPEDFVTTTQRKERELVHNLPSWANFSPLIKVIGTTNHEIYNSGVPTNRKGKQCRVTELSLQTIWNSVVSKNSTSFV